MNLEIPSPIFDAIASGSQFFRSCYVGSRKCSIGDFVVVHKRKSSSQDARVLRIETFSSKGSASAKSVQVYSTPFLRKKDVPNLNLDRRELIMDKRNRVGSEVHVDDLEADDSESFYFRSGYDGTRKRLLTKEDIKPAFEFNLKRSCSKSKNDSENQSPLRERKLMAVSTPSVIRLEPLQDISQLGYNSAASQSDDIDEQLDERFLRHTKEKQKTKDGVPQDTRRPNLILNKKETQQQAERSLQDNHFKVKPLTRSRHGSTSSLNPRMANGRSDIKSRRVGRKDLIEAVNYGTQTNQNPYDFTSDDLSSPRKTDRRRKDEKSSSLGMREQSAKKETDSITTMRDNDCSFSNTPVHARSKRLSRVFVTPKEKSKESTPAGLKKITQSDAPTHRQRKSGRRKYWEANSLLDTSSSESEDEKKPRKSSNAREVKKRGGANSQHQEVSSVSTKPEVPRAVRHTRKRLIENPTPLTQTKPKDESHHRNTEGRDNEVERLEMANSDEEIILTQSIRSTREQVKILPEYMESNVEPPLSCRTRRHTLSSMSSTQQHQGKSTNQLEKTKLKRGCERLMMEKVSDSADSSEAPSDSEPVKHKFRRSARRQSIYKPDDRRSTRASSQTPLQVSGRHTPTPQSQTQLRRTPHRKAKSRVQYTSEPDQKSDSDYEGLSDSSDASGDSKDRKHSSKTRTDKGKASQTRHSRLSTFTPSVQERRKPVKERGTVLERARAQLHVSAVPISLPCREEEFANILGYVEGKLESGTGGCLYISGVPGTGKTATVLEVVRHLQQQSDHSLPGFKFIDVNGMRLTQPHQAFVQIYKGLKDKIVTADHATSLLDNIFCKDRRQESIVLLVDELDLLVTRKQEILYNLFDWPTKPKSRLVVLAIANTMDLPERVMMNRVSSRLGLNRMTFQPYTFQQLQEIVHSRLTGISAFDPDAVQLASRKVAAVSGDARRALDICRRSTEVAEADGQELVRMQHVNQALQEMFSSPKITAIRNCSIYEKVMLKALLAEFTRSGIEEATLCQVSRHVNALCSMERVPHIKMMQMMKVCSNLNNIKLILLECNGKGIYQRVRLNVGQDDVQYALREDKS